MQMKWLLAGLLLTSVCSANTTINELNEWNELERTSAFAKATARQVEHSTSNARLRLACKSDER